MPHGGTGTGAMTMTTRALEAGTRRGPFVVIRAVQSETPKRNKKYLCACKECKGVHIISSRVLGPSQSKVCPKKQYRYQKHDVVIGEMFGLLRVDGWGNPQRNDENCVMVSVTCTGCGNKLKDRPKFRLVYEHGPRACGSCASRDR